MVTIENSIKNYKRGELAKTILKVLAVGGILAASLALPGLTQVLAIFQPKNYRDRDRIKKNLNALQKRGMIRIYEKGSKSVVEITEAGERQILAYNLDEMKLARPKKWDKLWRIIVFDIPEKKKRLRMEINFRLQQIGLRPFQKSTFITQVECRKEIDFLGNYFGVRQYMKYILAKEVDDEYRLRNLFNINN